MNPFFPSNSSTLNSTPMRRWVQVWQWITLGMWIVATGVAVLDRGMPAASRWIAAGFGLLYGVWYWVLQKGRKRWGRDSIRNAITIGTMILLLGWMTSINGIYYMLFFSMYGLLFGWLELRLAIPLTILLSSVGALRMISESKLAFPQSTGIIVAFAFATAVAIAMGMFIDAIISQSEERRRMIQELEATRAELAAAERQAGIYQERQRLAREIHDTLAQGFTSIVMHLEAADQALPPAAESETARLHLDRARQTARDSLGEARRLVWALRPESLERESLSQALERVVQRWSLETAIRAKVEITGTPQELSPADQVTLLRCTQEALANVRKHARADQVNLTLSYLDDQVILDVQDNGSGFIPEALETAGPEKGGFGLIGMRERVQHQGGSLTVESEPGVGTTLVVALPIGLPAAIVVTEQERP